MTEIHQLYTSLGQGVEDLIVIHPDSNSVWTGLRDGNEKSGLVALCLTNLAIGFGVRLLMLRANRRQKMTPIGNMIIFDEAVKMIGYSTTFIFAIIVSGTEEPLSETIGHNLIFERHCGATCAFNCITKS